MLLPNNWTNLFLSYEETPFRTYLLLIVQYDVSKRRYEQRITMISLQDLFLNRRLQYGLVNQKKPDERPVRYFAFNVQC